MNQDNGVIIPPGIISNIKEEIGLMEREIGVMKDNAAIMKSFTGDPEFQKFTATNRGQSYYENIDLVVKGIEYYGDLFKQLISSTNLVLEEQLARHNERYNNDNGGY